jgi:hypothetical protein
MDCICPNNSCTQSVTGETTYCTCVTIIENISCPEGCETIIRENGTAYCRCVDEVEPIITTLKVPIYFDNTDFFEDVSWTISYNLLGGSWGSYFSFYPDYSPYNNNYFQVGYNWGVDRETLWNHTMNTSSFQVFQGRLHPFVIEFPIASDNRTKMLNSLSLNVEAKRYQNQWNSSVWKGVGFNKLTIWNNTSNSGQLNLVGQKTISDARKYPKTSSDGNSQDILFVPQDGKHNINYFFNRIMNQDSNIPMWKRDKNNINKELNNRAISFRGKRTNERIKGDVQLINLTNDLESRFNIILRSSINDETILE